MEVERAVRAPFAVQNSMNGPNGTKGLVPFPKRPAGIEINQGAGKERRKNLTLITLA
jgi:hypothetical protein